MYLQNYFCNTVLMMIQSLRSIEDLGTYIVGIGVIFCASAVMSRHINITLHFSHLRVFECFYSAV